MSIKYFSNKGHQTVELLDEFNLIRNIDGMIEAFSEPILDHANLSKQSQDTMQTFLSVPQPY